MCTPLAGSIGRKPSPSRGFACHSRGCSGPLLARRSQTPRNGSVLTARKMKYSVMGAGRKAKICMKVYAFDVDETLYLSQGPVQWEALVALRAYTSPDDRRAADAAGWRFISEGAFAAGGR